MRASWYHPGFDTADQAQRCNYTESTKYWLGGKEKRMERWEHALDDAGAHLLAHWLLSMFLSSVIDHTTAWTTVSFPSTNSFNGWVGRGQRDNCPTYECHAITPESAPIETEGACPQTTLLEGERVWTRWGLNPRYFDREAGAYSTRPYSLTGRGWWRWNLQRGNPSL